MLKLNADARPPSRSHGECSNSPSSKLRKAYMNVIRNKWRLKLLAEGC